MLKRLFSAHSIHTNGSLSRLPDAELFVLLREEKQVSESAFSELYSRHARRIYSYCRYVFGDEDQAKDVFQEAFMRFYESARSGREVTNVPAYLLIITRNLCLNVKSSKRATVSYDEFYHLQQEPGREHGELIHLIKKAMELLPDDQREAFYLREFEDLPYDEIAGILQTTAVNARVRVTRARSRIREILKPYILELSQH
jgi:RNA polymerase sigma-70 factor, ECF subfamily